MGKFKINGELDINQYLTAASTLYITSDSGTPIIFRHGETECARINPSGCLNIGSTQTSGDYKLYVNGVSKFGGNITPTEPLTYNLGMAAYPWKSVVSKRFCAADGKNSVPYGDLKSYTEGTTAQQGLGLLQLGNNVSTGTAGNASGTLQLYSSSTGYTALRATEETTTETMHYLPDVSGTLVNSATFDDYITVSNNWGAGTTAGPTLTTTVNGVTGTAVTIPSASTSASGVITTGNQEFAGQKTFRYPKIKPTSTSASGVGLFFLNNKNTTVADLWYSPGDPNNVTTGYFRFEQYSPNSTANNNTTGYAEVYSLPTVSSGLTANKLYEIFTSKSYTTLDGRYVNVAGDTMTGRLTTTGLTISSTSAAKHLEFSRASANYFAAPASGYFAFLPNGKTLTIDNCDCIISDGSVYPGKSNTVSLGTSSYRWKNIFCCSKITVSGPTNATMDNTTTNPQIAFSENGSQEVGLVYTDYNNYRSPAGLKVIGIGADSSPAWFEVEGNIYGSKVYGAVWNDYAEFRNQDEEIEPGYCVTSSKSGKIYKTVERLQYCEGIVSDTYGFSIGETNDCKTPLAVSGRVLAYYDGNIDDYEIGDVVCATKNGLITKMTREEIKEYPDRIVGAVSEIPSYDTWGSGNVSTTGRIWIKVK